MDKNTANFESAPQIVPPPLPTAPQAVAPAVPAAQPPPLPSAPQAVAAAVPEIPLSQAAPAAAPEIPLSPAAPAAVPAVPAAQPPPLPSAPQAVAAAVPEIPLSPAAPAAAPGIQTAPQNFVPRQTAPRSSGVGFGVTSMVFGIILFCSTALAGILALNNIVLFIIFNSCFMKAGYLLFMTLTIVYGIKSLVRDKGHGMAVTGIILATIGVLLVEIAVQVSFALQYSMNSSALNRDLKYLVELPRAMEFIKLFM